MSDPEQSGSNVNGSENELSPEALALMGKARRSFGFAIGILLLGFMAIGVALVYRVMRDAPPAEMAESVSVPAGAEVVSALVAEGQVQVTYRAGGVVTLAVFDAASGELLRQVVIAAE